ncbi:YggT family protein [Actinomyces wuliandei]|uniref:YggT family protein n=1 Tax=Actinomyces wuliandei TaxID=2057743 RepID=UPI000FDB6825|nr:YggT family protein [Actinomyces wuliandei]
MGPLALAARILSSLLSLYTLVLLVRVVLDWVQMFARQWRPTGVVLVLANLVYALTDPPLRWIRGVLPMLRMGRLGIDLSFLVLFLGIIVVQRLLVLLI